MGGIRRSTRFRMVTVLDTVSGISLSRTVPCRRAPMLPLSTRPPSPRSANERENRLPTANCRRVFASKIDRGTSVAWLRDSRDSLDVPSLSRQANRDRANPETASRLRAFSPPSYRHTCGNKRQRCGNAATRDDDRERRTSRSRRLSRIGRFAREGEPTPCKTLGFGNGMPLPLSPLSSHRRFQGRRLAGRQPHPASDAPGADRHTSSRGELRPCGC